MPHPPVAWGGIVLALLGRSLGRDEWIILGMSGALLHVWNHALFKALLFLSAGSVIHAVHTREIDHLGGLAKRMPLTALCFVVGAVAICGLPPLNGFVSEFLIYLGLSGTLGIEGESSFAEAAFAAPAFFLGLLVLAKLTGSLQLAEMLGDLLAPSHWRTAGASLFLVMLSWCIVLLVENCRIPFDDPNTHLELTMIHEVMVLDTYAAVPSPKLVIAVGACAISGGPFIDNPEVHNGCGSIVPVDLFIPGCPPHPMTILDGLLRLLGRLELNA